MLNVDLTKNRGSVILKECVCVRVCVRVCVGVGVGVGVGVCTLVQGKSL